MSLNSTWHARRGDRVDVRLSPAVPSLVPGTPDTPAFAVLRFNHSLLADFTFAVQSSSPAALRDLARAATEAADWLDTQPCPERTP